MKKLLLLGIVFLFPLLALASLIRYASPTQ
jgi:hypothetical protein